MSYSVGELAKLTGVSVGTLHHFDDQAAGLSAYVRDAIVANAERGR